MQEIITGNGNIFSRRRNCVGYFGIITVDEVLKKPAVPHSKHLFVR